MLTKIKVLNTISQLSDRFSIDELIEKMMVLEKIEKGLEDAEKGNLLTEEELEEKMKGWPR